jgi:hypothetical protein
MRIVASVRMGSTPVLNYYVTFFLVKSRPVRAVFFIPGKGLFFQTASAIIAMKSNSKEPFP